MQDMSGFLLIALLFLCCSMPVKLGFFFVHRLKKKKDLRGLKQSGTRTELKMSKKKKQQVSKDKLLKSGVTQNDTKVSQLSSTSD